eukprot:Skav200654  [mRNA]  locus=scaffold2539:163913:170665:+ [translate_table: standard]
MLRTKTAKTAVFSKLEGELGEKAASLAASLQSEDERKEWLELLEAGKEDWEEVKLVLGLLWQKAAEEGRDGGPLGYPMAFTRLVEGVYEGPEGNEILVADVEARLTQVPAGDPAGDPDVWRRAVALSCFKELSFVKRGAAGSAAGLQTKAGRQVKDRQMRGGHAPVAGGHFDGGRNDHFAAVSEEDLEAAVSQAGLFCFADHLREAVSAEPGTAGARLRRRRQKAPPEIRIHVLQNFKPKQEGEADYSALIISYCKKMREHSQQAMPVQPVHMQPMMQPVQQIPMQMQHYGEHYPIPAPQRAPWNQPAQPPPVAPRGSLMGASESNANIYALEGFRQRYPMDDRAFDFLKCASAFVQQEVLERFSPQKQDSDYSALIISFAKKCREREPAMNAAKRPRMF